MAHTIKDVMTRDPVTCDASMPLTEVAQLMRDHDIGDVLVNDGSGQLRGIVTDRDIVVRSVASGIDVSRTTLADVCSGEPVWVTPDSTLDDAAAMMRQMAVRRLPVVEQGTAVGIVSIGDLAIEREPHSALADISAAPANG